jgi:hypothetical protein
VAIKVRAMGKRRFRASQVRRFLATAVVTALVSGLLARGYGEQVVGMVDRLPASASGFQVLGWLLGGPPLLVAAMAWNDRGRLDAERRRKRAVLYGVWFGLGGFLVPALTGDPSEFFGQHVATGNQLGYGWACGAVANVAAIAFATGIGVLRARAAPGGVAPESELATRFVEIAWTVLLGIGLLFAAYGAQLGFRY